MLITRSLVHFRKSLTWLFPPFLSFPLINAPPFNFRDGEGEIATAYGNSPAKDRSSRVRAVPPTHYPSFLPGSLPIPSFPSFSRPKYRLINVAERVDALCERASGGVVGSVAHGPVPRQLNTLFENASRHRADFWVRKRQSSVI